jgi:hypothetical protein
MTLKSKALTKLEEHIEQAGDDSLRRGVLEKAKAFKTSWLELGQALHAVYQDRLFKTWGYSSFDIYTAKEIGIRKETAMKLLRSYYFLEKEEPQYLKQEFREECEAKQVPSYEAVNVLRLAKNNKEIEKEDY